MARINQYFNEKELGPIDTCLTKPMLSGKQGTEMFITNR